MGKRWSCKATAAKLFDKAKLGVEALSVRGIQPHLVVILVGENPASQVYVGKKTEGCESIGMKSSCIRLTQDVSEKELLDHIQRLNEDAEVHGILVQLPLPDHISTDRVIQCIHPDKDVDGFHPVNVGRLSLGQAGLIPCTPMGVMALLHDSGYELKGKRAVVVGRSDIVGKPMVQLLLREHATVTVMHSRTVNPESVCREADLVIAAVGQPGLIKADWLKEGAWVVDVGINEIRSPEQAAQLLEPESRKARRFAERGRMLYGDVHYHSALKVAEKVTPVPGGIGTLTIGQLMCNCVEAAELCLVEEHHGK